jgi:hypothetical protein
MHQPETSQDAPHAPHGMHLTGLSMHVQHALPHDVTDRCMQLLHGLCCFDFVSDIPLSPATLDLARAEMQQRITSVLNPALKS